MAKIQGIFFVAWLSLATFHVARSQFDNIRLKQLSIEQGLPGVTVQEILQDKKGLLWFGIESVGLCKFDGHNFQVYQNIPDDNTSITNNFASALCEDDKGFIWVGTRNGLNRFDRNTGKFVRYLNDPSDPASLSHNLIWDIKKDKDGNLWIATEYGIDKFNETKNSFIHYLGHREGLAQSMRVICLYADKIGGIWAGTRNFGLYHVLPAIEGDSSPHSNAMGNRGQIKNWRHDEQDNTSLRHNEIREIMEAGPGKLWIGTLTGMDKFDISNGDFEHIQFTREGKSILKEFIVSAFCPDDRGYLWVGTTNNGLLIINPKTYDYRYVYTDPYKPQGIKSNSIRSIIQDNSGLIWIGTKFAGLEIYDKRQETFPIIKEFVQEKKGISEDFILSIFQDSKGFFWFGTKGGGLNRYDKLAGKYTYYVTDRNNPYSISSNRIEDIVEDQESNLWLATENGLNYFDRYSERFYHYGDIHVRSLELDRYGTIWIGTTDGLFVFNRKSKLITKHPSKQGLFNDPTSNITKIYEDRTGKVWYCTYQSGIYEYDPVSDDLVHFLNDKQDTTSISGNMIRSVYEDRSGRLWIGTLSDGLNGYDRYKKQFSHYKTTHGLASNTVYTIIEDHRGKLWLGTHDGISKFDPENEQFENFNIDYGLQGKVFEINAAAIARDGEMYFGGSKGINHFYPENVHKNTESGPMIISSVKLFDRIIATDITDYCEIKLSYRDNYVFIDFSLLEYSDPTRNEYAYKLEGLDNDFIYSGNRHFTSYTSLDPGEYTFIAKGANIDKNWNEDGITIKIIIPKPYWKKAWFIVLLIVLGISLVVSIYLLRIRAIHKQQIILQDNVKQKTKDLRQAYNILEKQKLEIEKRNIELTRQSEQIRTQNAELEEHRNKLEGLVKERTKDLERAKEKAEESDRLKSAFLANMSHEIRTPLNAIVGFSEVLANEKLTENEIIKYNTILQKNSITLLQLIDDIIDISKIEAGQIKIHKTQLHLNSFIYNIYDIYREILVHRNREGEKDIELFYTLNEDLKNVHLFTDKARLKQIMDNLLSNAVKFTKQGSIEIGYTYNKSAGIARLFVKDTGIGIEKRNHEIIFDRFRKLESTSNELYRGTGIGLSITKNLVEMLGGRIWVESEAGKGSTFFVDMPALGEKVPGYHWIEPGEDILMQKPDWEGKKILIIEDEESNFLVLNTILNPTKAKTIWAKNGEEGVTRFFENEDTIDLVLLDIELPGIKGTEVIDYLREQNKKIPIIAQTAYAMQNEEHEIMKKGFDGYMIKPFLSNKVYAILSKYLS